MVNEHVSQILQFVPKSLTVFPLNLSRGGGGGGFRKFNDSSVKAEMQAKDM